MTTWTPEQIDQLKRIAHESTVMELMVSMGKPYGEVRSMIKKLRLKAKRRGERTDADDRKIADHAETYGAAAACEAFSLTPRTLREIIAHSNAVREKRVQALSPAEVQAFRKRAIKLAYALNYWELADDFGSYAVIANYGRPIEVLKNCFYSFLRAHNGDPTTEKGRAKDAARKLNNLAEFDFDVMTGTDLDADERLLKLINALDLDRELHIVAVLKILWGMSFVEIGHVMSLHDTRVQILWKRVLERAAKSVNPQQGFIK